MVVGPAVAEEVFIYEEPTIAYIPEIITTPQVVLPTPVVYQPQRTEVMMPYMNPAVYYTPNYPYTIPAQP